jgi:hypothetical protein
MRLAEVIDRGLAAAGTTCRAPTGELHVWIRVR